MTDPKDLSREGADPRRRAEAKLREEAIALEKLSPAEVTELIQALRLHKLELELENEQLKNSLLELRGQQEELQQIAAARAVALSQSQEQLRQAHENLTALLQASPLGIGIFDQKGQLMQFNPAAELIFGRCEELSEGSSSASYHLMAQEESQALVARVLRGKTVTGVELKHRRQSGGDVDLSLSVAPLYNPDANIRGFVCLCEDISERKRQESAMQTQGRVLENMAEGVTLTDEHGVIVYTNPAFDRMFGYKAGELLGQHSSKLNYEPPEINEPFIREILRQVDDTGVWRGEFHNVRKDGVGFFSLAHISSLEVDGCNLLISLQEDITERKRAAAALEQSERRFRQLVESIPQLVWTCNPSGACDFLSKQWIEFTGIPETEQLGYGWLNQIHPDDRERLMAAWKRSVADGSYFTIEFRIRRHDGEYHWFYTRAVPWTDEQGRIVKWFGTNTDITERKRAEAALQESEARYRSLFKNNHTIMLLIDPKTGDIIDANPAASIYYGYPQAELIGKKISEINTLGETQVLAAMQTAKSGERRQFHFQHRLASGDIRNVDIFSGPIVIRGKELLYSIVHDVTERQRLEVALKQSEERLRLAAQAGRMFAFDWDPLTDEVTRSAECADILGLTGAVQKDTGDGYLAKVHPEDRDELVATVRSLSPQNDCYTVQYRIIRGIDKKVVTLEEHACAFFDDSGQMTRLYGMSLDITARQKAAEALRESEERYRRLVELSPDAILVLQNKRYVYANKAAALLFGAAKQDELHGREVFALLHADFHELVRGRLAQVNTGKAAALQELKILRLDGTPVDVESTAVPIEYQGQPAVQVILRDITECRKAEKEIIHLASFPQLNPNLVLEIDSTGVVTFANKASYRILKDLSPESSLSIFFPEDWDEVQRIALQSGERLFSREVKVGGAFFSETILFIDPLKVWRIYGSDITKRKQAEEDLRRERDFNAALLNTLGALVVVLDRDGRIVHFNRACEASTGYSFAEVQGRLFFDIFLLPDEKKAVQEVFRKLRSGDVPTNHENHWLTRSGKKNLISWSNTTLNDTDGQVTYVIGTGIDITRQRRAEEAVHRAHEELERRVSSRTEQLRHTVDKLLIEILERERAEAKLKASEARFAAFMRHLPGSAIMRDRAGRFLFVNESWEKTVGRRSGESLGKTLFDFWPREIAQRLHEYDQEVFNQNQPIESRIELPVGGKLRTFLSYRFPIRGETGEVEMIGAIGIDITERLKAEESRDRLIEILEATPDFVGSADREGRLFYLNRAARDMLGLTDQDLIDGMTFANTHPAWAVDFVLAEGRPVYAREGSWRGETAILHRDGTEIPVSQVILAHRTPEGRIKFFSTICRDITERKRAEENLRKSEEKLRLLTTQLLTAQEDERKRLAAELHDELGHALLTLKLQLSAVERGLLPEQADLKEKMRQIVAYLTDTVEEVRRLYHDLSPGDLEDLGLTTALLNMVEDFQEFYQGIEWNVELADIDRFFPLPVQTMIYRIIQEALTNIGKHAYPTHVNVKATKEDLQVVFRIDDDGRGFAMDEVLDGDNGTKGMGLAAMSQRVSLAGGVLDLWSRENQGARIIFRIPFTPEEERI